MRFDLIRLVLIPQANLFASPLTREEWIRSVFAEPFPFVHRKRRYFFVPVSPETPEGDQLPIIMGRVGRARIVRENEPPEAKLEAMQRESWMAAHVYIDPRHHEDGQKVAFEHSEVGEPLSIMRSLAVHIERRTDAPYVVKANPISRMENFLSFLEKHPDDVTYVQFDLNVPNMFGDRTNIDTEMREAKEKYRARRARITLASEEGMRLNEQRIRDMASYALEGGGQIKAKTKDDDTFSSSTKIESANIDLPEDADERTILSIIWDRIFRR